jgi:hypothetical protein
VREFTSRGLNDIPSSHLDNKGSNSAHTTFAFPCSFRSLSVVQPVFQSQPPSSLSHSETLSLRPRSFGFQNNNIPCGGTWGSIPQLDSNCVISPAATDQLDCGCFFPTPRHQYLRRQGLVTTPSVLIDFFGCGTKSQPPSRVNPLLVSWGLV